MMASLFNEEFMNYYDWKRYTIKPDAIKKRLKILRSNGFSDKFVKILASMLEVNDFQRIAVNELYNACEIGSRGGQNPTKQPDQMLRGSTPYSGGSFNNESYGQKKSPAQDLSMRPTYDASTVKSGQHSREDIISMLSKNQNRGSNQVNFIFFPANPKIRIRAEPQMLCPPDSARRAMNPKGLWGKSTKISIPKSKRLLSSATARNNLAGRRQAKAEVICRKPSYLAPTMVATADKPH